MRIEKDSCYQRSYPSHKDCIYFKELEEKELKYKNKVVILIPYEPFYCSKRNIIEHGYNTPACSSCILKKTNQPPEGYFLGTGAG
jgi:hypothetical protein